MKIPDHLEGYQRTLYKRYVTEDGATPEVASFLAGLFGRRVDGAIISSPTTYVRTAQGGLLALLELQSPGLLNDFLTIRERQIVPEKE